MNRRERNPHARPPADAARDRVLERRDRLAKIAGRPAPAPAANLEAIAASLERLERLGGVTVRDFQERVGESIRRVTRSVEDFQERMRLSAALVAPTTAALELVAAAERARFVGVDVDAVLEANRSHPTRSNLEALNLAIRDAGRR